MVSSARRTINCFLLLLCTAICLHAQTAAQKTANGSITGKVTIKGKPAAGVTVFARATNERNMQNPTRGRAKTDQNGSYRLSNLPPDTYEVSAIAPALVPTNESNPIVVGDGEQVEDVNLSLTSGGVITGKITDSEGEPLIATSVRITPDYSKLPAGWSHNRFPMRLMMGYATDDRGIYRAFGLPPGKYKVSAGDSDTGKKNSREYYKETFYPSVTDAAKATVVEVTEGSETVDINIMMGAPARTFQVAGRVIDGETGNPVPNLNYGVGQRIVHDESGSSGTATVGNEVTGANGEFRMQNVAPGTYTIFTVPAEGSVHPRASVTFDVVDRDLTDLVITVGKGGSFSGVVVVDGNQKASVKVSGLRVCVVPQNSDSNFFESDGAAVAQDGSFRIDGVRSGSVRLWLCHGSEETQQFEIVRVERNGVPQPENLTVKQGEHIAGLRVLVKHSKLTGGLRGQVKVENGELPPISQLSLILMPLDENLEPLATHSISTPQLDARGRFFAEHLPAGTYRVRVSFNTPAVRISEWSFRHKTLASTTEQVVVNDDAVTDVTLILKLPSPK